MIIKKLYIVLKCKCCTLGNVEIVCNPDKNGDHVNNGINTQEVHSISTAPVNNVDVVNNNKSQKIGKKLKKNSKKDKSMDKNDKDIKINEVSHSDDSSEESTENDKKQDTEIIFIQDLGFNVKIVCPGTEAFEIQVSQIK